MSKNKPNTNIDTKFSKEEIAENLSEYTSDYYENGITTQKDMEKYLDWLYKKLYVWS